MLLMHRWLSFRNRDVAAKNKAVFPGVVTGRFQQLNVPYLVPLNARYYTNTLDIILHLQKLIPTLIFLNIICSDIIKHKSVTTYVLLLKWKAAINHFEMKHCNWINYGVWIRKFVTKFTYYYWRDKLIFIAIGVQNC